MKSFASVALAAAASVAVLAASALATPPQTYTADSTTNVYAKPSVTDGGALDLEFVGGSPKVAGHGAGYVFTPTDFNCTMVRVTDPNTASGKALFGPSTWMSQGWNVNSTKFYITDSGGVTYVYNFTPYNMALSQVSGTFGGLTDWDGNNANIAYGKQGTNIAQWDFSTTPPTVTNIFDVSGVCTSTGIYEVHPSAGTAHGGSQNIKYAVVTGGNGTQGSDYEVVWYNKSTGAGFVYNTVLGQIKDFSGTVVASGIPSTYYIHQGSITRDGRYVWIAQQGSLLGGTVGGPFVWDTTNQTVTGLGGQPKPGGHMAMGFAEMVNDVYDSANQYFYYRTCAALGTAINMVSVPSTFHTPNGYDDHPCWNQCQNGATHLPYFSATIQSGGTYNQSPNYWSDEILGVATTDRTGGLANTVYRFAHHRSTITAHPDGTHTGGSSYDDYYANAWPNVSQDGLFCMFQSNWEETLGTRQGGTIGGSPWYYFRDDVFIIKLPH